MSSVISGLSPQPLWDHFSRIAAIPRPSKKEQKIAAHVLGLAKGAGLEAHQDLLGNIVVSKKASPGNEQAPIVALQSHLDMVCEKNREVQHNFDTDGIQLVRSDGYIRAKGTTLGSDNGIGVAAALAVMLDQTIVHGPLEFLFTIDEETGLTGAGGLQAGFLRSKILLNLDTEEEGALYVGCAGGRDSLLTFSFKREPPPSGYQSFLVSVSGLKGGHSGVDIHLGRGNALKILGRVLRDLSHRGNILLAHIEGGSKRNAIPREAEAIVYADAESASLFQDHIAQLKSAIGKELLSVDPGVTIELTRNSGRIDSPPFRRSDGERVIALLYNIPHGVLAMSADIDGLVETSTNVATIETTPDRVVVGTSQRSSVNASLDSAVKMIGALGVIEGAAVETTDGYPGWKPDLDSVSLKAARETYHALFGRDPEIKAIHAGLECGIIGERFPGMDMVSFGPTIEGAHSPDERVNIASVQKFWDLLIGVLKTLTTVSATHSQAA